MRVKHQSFVVFLGVFFGPMVSALAAEDVSPWLDKMQRALSTQSFQGTLIIRQHNQMHTLRVTHGHEHGGWDNVESLDGEKRQVLRQAGRVTTLFPERKLATISSEQMVSPLHPDLLQDRAQVSQNYDLQVAGEGRVAQRVAQIIAFVPRDHYRYGFRYWLDKESGLLLRSDMLDQQGQVLEQVMYSELSVASDLIAPSVPDLKGYRVVQLDAQPDAAPVKVSHWNVQQLPPGFKLVRSSIRPSVHGDGKVTQMVFSDGLTSVSVFVEDHVSQQREMNGESHMGVMNTYGRQLNGYHVIVMGEVPADSVRQIAQSVNVETESGHD